MEFCNSILCQDENSKVKAEMDSFDSQCVVIAKRMLVLRLKQKFVSTNYFPKFLRFEIPAKCIGSYVIIRLFSWNLSCVWP